MMLTQTVRSDARTIDQSSLRDLASFHNRHAGETVVVCGCGESLNEFEQPERFITIGVNDIGRRFHPSYLVVVNPRAQFKKERWPYVERSEAEYLFTQLVDLPVKHPQIVRFKLGTKGGTELSNPNVLHYTQNSPYVALCLAAHMGAKRIGLIGVDFTDHHFFAKTGRHALSRQLPRIDQEYGRLTRVLLARGIEVVNLSSTSRLTTIPKVRPDEFANDYNVRSRTHSEISSLRVVSYSTTPVAGVPAILARCITARTQHRARCVWARNTYGNGVIFQSDIEWSKSSREAIEALEQAEVVIVHNGKVDPRHQSLLASKPIVTMAHNYMWNVDQRFVRDGNPGVVVGQYQATLPEFRGWSVVPNPIPLWEPAFGPDTKSNVVTICYTPSGKHEQYPPNHRLYWHGKGYLTTMAVLDRLAKQFPIRIETIQGRQISHADSLAMKHRAHIVIDECVTGSYHRNSLEGLAAGCVVVNGVGRLPEIADALRRCAPGADRLPFVFSSLDTLEAVLGVLIERGASTLREDGRANRIWMEQHWDFAAQWERSWAPVVEAARSARSQLSKSVPCLRNLRTPPSEAVMNRQADGMVTVVIPHGGVDRLPQLITTLATMRQRSGVGEVIVAEMGERPVAELVANQWADKHLFIESGGPFERARALNAGAAVAEYEFILWQDNDLLLAPTFIAKCLKELCDRGLDYLIPYTSVRYLSERDSQAVMRGERNPEDCRPANTLHSGGGAAMCSGGLGLVRRSFFRQYGGLVEGFRGWGGEDNAWNCKVALLGRSAPTTHREQHVYHLYHLNSGGYQTAAPSGGNPHYLENVALLGRVWAVRSAKQFMEQFPPATPATGSFTLSNGKRRALQSNDTMPVWAYWEGPCPPWIRACRRTIAAHAQQIRFLTPESFDRLWDRDRDIDLSRLRVAHRADYIRAFLLHRYGGLWIDSDCLVMQPLQPLLDVLAAHDFVGHRERSGLISNGFIGACPGSRIASQFYDRVCRILRTRRPLQWTTIGSEPLSAVINDNARGWYELPCERVQPVCWSHPEEFFANCHTADHEQSFDPNALCYMLSNVQINNYSDSHNHPNILDKRTFFSYLLRKSLGEKEQGMPDVCEDIFATHAELYRQYRDESLSGPGSGVAQTQELRERLPLLIASLGIQTLLDAPCGDVNWMRHVNLGETEYIGVDINREIIATNQWLYASPLRRFQRTDLIHEQLPCADAILCRDLLPHLPFDHIIRTIENFKSSGATYMITTTFTNVRPNHDILTGEWRPVNLTLPPFNFPPPMRLISEKCTEGNGAFSDKSLGLWCLADLPLQDMDCGAA